jgi:hypothetical protein
MKAQRFGIEIEMTGLTRQTAASTAARYFGADVRHFGGAYDEYNTPDPEGRKWKFVRDASIQGQIRVDRQPTDTDDDRYKVEMVSPICRWDDIETVQQLVRELRSVGAMGNSSCGIHVHVDASPFDAQALRNITNIMAAKEDLIYKALRVEVARELQYCKKTDLRWLDELNRKKPKTLDEVSRIWYDGESVRAGNHYDRSRYHCLSLHSVFSRGTLEFRLFNSDIQHVGKIKAYIQLSLAIAAQALNQRSASRIRTQSTNEKYTFRTWLLRLGLIGDEFSTARTHLLEHLDGCIAWKDPAQAEAQKERIRQKREKERQLSREDAQAGSFPTSEPAPSGDVWEDALAVSSPAPEPNMETRLMFDAPDDALDMETRLAFDALEEAPDDTPNYAPNDAPGMNLIMRM